MSNDLKIRALLEDHVSSGLAKMRDTLDQVGGKGAAAVFTGNIAAQGLNLIGNAAYDAGRAIGTFIDDSITAASDLNETMSKSQVVFGQAAQQVSDWGDTSAEAFGLSKQAAVEAAASFGNVFKGLGFAQDTSAQMSETLVKLAGDLASFNNIDVGDALQKLQSGLAGETRPLRDLGVFISEANVKAEAAKLGFHAVNGEFTDGEKIIARYNLILQQTTTAQGDFARTSDQLANSQRKANAELENTKARLGEELIPVQQGATNALLDFFTGLNAVADQMSGKVTPDLIQLTERFSGHAAAVKYASDNLHVMSDAALDTAQAMGLLTAQQVYAEKEARGLIVAMDGVENHTGKVADDTALATVEIAKLGDAAHIAGVKAAIAFDGMKVASAAMRDALLADAEKLVDDYFDVLITQDQLSATNAEIAAQKKIIASKNSSAAEVRDAKAKLHQLQSDQSQELRDLASHGATSSKVFQKTYNQIFQSVDTLTGHARDVALASLYAIEGEAAKAYAKIQKTLAAGAGGNLSSYGGGRAVGGPVMAGMTYTVGESGPETLVMGSGGGGYVLPNAGGGGSGGGGRSQTPQVIQLVVDGRVLAEVVDYHLGAMADAAPAGY